MQWVVVAPAARIAVCGVGVGVNTACRVQYQESNVASGYGVGWSPPPGLAVPVGINSWAGRRLGVGE